MFDVAQITPGWVIATLLALCACLVAAVALAGLAVARGQVLRGVRAQLGERERQLGELQQTTAELGQQVQRAEQQAAELREAQHHTLREQAVLQSRLDHTFSNNNGLQRQVQELDETLRRVRTESGNLQAEAAALRAELKQTRSAADDKLKMLNEARTQLSHEFQNLAQRIFDDKSQRFRQDSQAGLEQTLQPLRAQLGEFRQRVEHVYERETQDRITLRTELQQLRELNLKMSEEAVSLTRALKGDSKAQGNWGEVVLERVLEESGLRKGHEYDTQVSLQGSDGDRRAPDVIVRLPENKDVIIDAKVSLVHYERYCSALDEDERRLAMKQHIASVRAHINGLSVKDYENLEGVRSLDFVLIFVPVEAAFLAAFEHDPGVFREAYDKNIIVVSPTTLLATLRTVHSIWRYEHRNQNAERIALEAGRLHDQFARVLESLQELGRQLDRAQVSYDLTLKRFAQGRGNLVGRVDKLRRLGAKAKKRLPAASLAMADAGEEDMLADGSVDEEALLDDSDEEEFSELSQPAHAPSALEQSEPE